MPRAGKSSRSTRSSCCSLPGMFFSFKRNHRAAPSRFPLRRASLFGQNSARPSKSTARIVESPLPLFESIGGGSARCMMADVHLPRN